MGCSGHWPGDARVIEYECYGIVGKAGTYRGVHVALEPHVARMQEPREAALGLRLGELLADEPEAFEYALAGRQRCGIGTLRLYEAPGLVPQEPMGPLPGHADGWQDALEMTRGRVHGLVWRECHEALHELDAWLAVLEKQRSRLALIAGELGTLGEYKDGEWLIGGPPGTKRAIMGLLGASADLYPMLAADVQEQIQESKAVLVEHARVFVKGAGL